jgi:hypothetical protein
MKYSVGIYGPSHELNRKVVTNSTIYLHIRPPILINFIAFKSRQKVRMLRLRVVSSKNDIDDLDRNEQIIHLSFKASNNDIFRLLLNCPKINAIQFPTSYRKGLSRAGEMFLAMQGIELIEGDVFGDRKDVQGYYNINDEVFNRVEQLSATGLGSNEIAGTVSREAKLPLGLVEYVIKHSS